MAAEILRLAGEFVRPGMTTDEIDAYVHQLTI
jgi:methionine aminopeptidase